MPEPSARSLGDVVVALAQIPARQAWAEETAVGANTKMVRSLYEMYADETDLVVFPELALTGYIPLKGYDQRRKRILSKAAEEAAGTSLPELLEATKGRRAVMVLGLMEPAAMRYEFYNSVAVLDNGSIAAVYRKVHLPVEENHYFMPGHEVVVAETRAGVIAPMICYDLLFPEVTRIAALRGVEIIVMVSNWLDIGHLRRLGEVLPVARALESHAHVLFVNGVGDLEARGHRFTLYGRSRAVTATGEVVAEADGAEGVLVANLPGADLAAASEVFPVMRDRRPEAYHPLIAPASDFASLAVDPADD